MTKVVRTFLMWMMLLALPVQGMAQTSMFACHLNGESTGSAQLMDHGDMDHASMDHNMHGMDNHESSGNDDPRKLMKSLHGCCNCAPTCAVVLLPTTQASFSAIQHDIVHLASSSQIPYSVDTRRIDRPPKNLAV